ncbi:MAG: hypothetical protein VYC34_07510, partial [Planctomycetota bacterium]|nr:hypothetical protein [Planctomycetota bacterium]
AIAIAAMGMGLGATNEVIEYAATLLVPETNVGGYVNTARDMVWNMIGSALAAALVVVRSRQSESALQPSG